MTASEINPDSVACVELDVAPSDIALLEEVVGALELTCASWESVESPRALVWVFADSAAQAEQYCHRLADRKSVV